MDAIWLGGNSYFQTTRCDINNAKTKNVVNTLPIILHRSENPSIFLYQLLRSGFLSQRHAALGTFARTVLNHFGVHRAVVSHRVVGVTAARFGFGLRFAASRLATSHAKNGGGQCDSHQCGYHPVCLFIRFVLLVCFVFLVSRRLQQFGEARPQLLPCPVNSRLNGFRRAFQNRPNLRVG